MVPRVALSALALLLAGCEAFDESLLPRDGGGPPCDPTVPPPRPAPTAPDDIGELIFVLRDAVLESAGRNTGYDLDGLCTSEASPTVECTPPEAGEGVPLDGMGGIDNVGGAELIPFVVVLIGDQEGPVGENQLVGLGTTLVRVRGWNGTPDDDVVDVAVAPAVLGGAGVGGVPPTLPGDGSLPPPPLWDGTDWFWADDGAFVGGDPESARIADDAAYVSGGTLVARLPDRSRFVLAAATFHYEILLSDVRFTAEIAGTRLSNVVLAGRWPGLDVIAASPGVGACAGTDAYMRIVRFVSLNADVRTVAGTGGEGAPCEALSLGIGFTGYPANFAGLLSARPLPNPCL